MYDDFAEFNSGNPDIKTGESTASYRIKVGLLGPEAVRNPNTSRYYKTPYGDQFAETGDAFVVHSHPENALAGPGYKDYNAVKTFSSYNIRSYLYEANGSFSELFISQKRNLYQGIVF